MSHADLDPRRLAEDDAVYQITVSISVDIIGDSGAVPLGIPPTRDATSFPVKEYDDDLIETATFLRNHVREFLTDAEDFYALDAPEPEE